MVLGCEENKVYIEETFGFSKLGKTIQCSHMELDISLFILFIEMASKGQSLSSMLSLRGEKIAHSEAGIFFLIYLFIFFFDI